MTHTGDIPRSSPRLPRFIPPAVDTRLAPLAQRVQDRPVDLQQSVAHRAEPFGSVGGAPVVAVRGRVRQTRTGAIGQVGTLV